MSKYTLTYEKSKSQEIYVEGVVKDENHVPYFEQEYDEARKLIKEIVDSQGTKEDCDKERGEKRDKIKKYGCNNRILFIGQRGCGKTSVMRSLAEYLSSDDNKNKKPKDHEDHDYDVKFCCLPMVDPSHFDNNNNILLTVITSMFSEAKKKMTKDGDKGDTAYREDLLKQFEKVFKSLDSIKSELSSYTLESLNRKSDAEDLKDKMKKLVDKYLVFQGCGDESRLVLLIDDIDMSVSHAPEMLEQLRKYLELDNLIILMSANLGQLSNEMREKYSSAFQYTLKDSNQALSIDVEDLATKYLLKLFPTSRRINVERLDSQLLETDLQGEINAEATDKDKPQGNFQKVILSLIWSKTRLLFIPKDSENTLHPIIPTNLRDLAQFLDMLTSLQDVESVKKDEKGDIEGNVLFASKTDYDKCEHNLQVFKNYVMKTWIPNHLKVDEELVFHNIPSDITEINKHLINSINIIGTKHKEDLMSRQVGLDIIEKNADNVFIDRDIYTMVSPNDPKFVKANKISDIFNQPSNYSYGDLLLMIDKYETYFESEEHRSFTDAIKIYYSILLFETMFFKSNNVVYDIYGEVARSFGAKEKDEIQNNYRGTSVENFVELKKLVKNVCEKDSQEDRDLMIINKRNELMSRKIPIQKLIGGNVYYPNYFEIITDKNFNQKGPSFDAKRAFYHKVKVDDGKKVGDSYPLFSVLYYGDIRPDRYEKDHIYDTTFNKNANIDGVNYVTFDILSVLNNMLNPCHTLSRLDNVNYQPNNWFSIVKNTENWGECNKIKNNDTKSKKEGTIPNAILPFYAVDLMLTYLRHDYSTDDLFDIHRPNITNAKNAANLVSIFFDVSPSDVPLILSHLIILLSKKYQSDSYFKRKNYNEVANYMITEDDEKILRELSCIQGTLSDDTRKQITAMLDKKWLISEDRDKFEAIALRGKSLSKANRDSLNKIAIKYLEIKRDADEYWLVSESRTKLETIATKDVNIDDGDKAAIDEIKKSGWVSVQDKETLERIDFSNGSISDSQQYRLNDIATRMCIKDKNKLIQDVVFSMYQSELDSILSLIENIEIILIAQKCFKNLSLSTDCNVLNHEEALTEMYRNHVIALILGMKLITKKEKDSLIKDLHKYYSISELFKHLVEVLWKNTITEMCVRGRIQEKVRSFSVVQAYYEKLWEETRKMLKLIDGILVDGNDSKTRPILVYENLFNKAKELFLSNDFS